MWFPAFELTSIPGNGVTSEPVAIKIFLVLTTSVDPSSFKAVTSLLPEILPCPLIRVTCKIKENKVNNYSEIPKNC